MSVGIVTCTTCNRQWDNDSAYKEDHVKCGGDKCPLITGYDRKARLETIANAVQRVKGTRPQIPMDVWIPGVIPDKHPNGEKGTQYVLEVPPVLVMNISKEVL